MPQCSRVDHEPNLPEAPPAGPAYPVPDPGTAPVAGPVHPAPVRGRGHPLPRGDPGPDRHIPGHAGQPAAPDRGGPRRRLQQVPVLKRE